MPPPPPPPCPRMIIGDHDHESTQAARQPDQQSAASPKPTSEEDHPARLCPPDFVDFDIDDNTDAMALRSAITILELQKEKCRRDFQVLNQLKQSLSQDPETFVQHFVKGSMRAPPRPTDPLLDAIAYDELPGTVDSMDHDDDHKEQDKSGYPAIPRMQKVARCPPINWAKYHIVGSPLDRMHEEQILRPTESVPLAGPLPRPGDAPLPGQAFSFSAPSAPVHHVFKAYDEFEDGTAKQYRRFELNQASTGVSTRRKSRK